MAFDQDLPIGPNLAGAIRRTLAAIQKGGNSIYTDEGHFQQALAFSDDLKMLVAEAERGVEGWDAVFRITINGKSHAVFASYNGGGSYSQWGAPREALSANVPTVEAWAAALYENGWDAADSGADPETAERLTDAGWRCDANGWTKIGGIPEGLTTAEALAHEFGEN